eukprot:142471_1
MVKLSKILLIVLFVFVACGECRLKRLSRNRRSSYAGGSRRRAYSDVKKEDTTVKESLKDVKAGLEGVMDGVKTKLKDTIGGDAGKDTKPVDIPASSEVSAAPVGDEENDDLAKNLYGDLKKEETEEKASIKASEGDHSDLSDDSTATDGESTSSDGESVSDSASSDESGGSNDSGPPASSEVEESDSASEGSNSKNGYYSADSDSASDYASGDSFSSDDSESMIDWHTNFEVRFNGLEAMKRLMAFLTVIALVVGIFVYWAWIMSMLASVTPSSIFGPEKKAKHIGEMQSLLPTTHVVDTSMAPHGLTPIAKRGAIVFVRQ